MDFEHLLSRGSRDGALLYQHGLTQPDTINIGFYDADRVNFNTTNDVCRGRIVGVIDTVTGTENVQIVRLAAA
jgi:hypothetical protein